MASSELFASDIPSHRQQLFVKMAGSVISGLRRYSWWLPNDAVVECGIQKSLVFSLTAGPLLLFLDNGTVIGVASDPSLVSVTIWMERDENGVMRIENSVLGDPELHSIDACDPIYSIKEMCDFVTCRIRSVHILVREPENTRWETLPREAGVVLVCENGHELILSHGLHNDSDDFSVITKEQIDPQVLRKLSEISLSELTSLGGVQE